MTLSPNDIEAIAQSTAVKLARILAPNLGWLSIEKVCEDTRMSRRYVLDLVRAGKLEANDSGRGKVRQISEASLQRYLNRNKKKLPKVK